MASTAAVHAAEPPPAMVRATLHHGGVERVYHVFVPPGARGSKTPLPLVVVLHGGGGRAERFARFTRFNEAATAHGFIAVYPQGIERRWNDGRSRVGFTTFVRNTDDVGFIVALIGEVAGKHHPVDRARVFAAGMSNGGMMAIRLACEAADRFAGIAAVAANMPERLRARCRPAKEIGVLMIRGTNDTIIPRRGGYVRRGLDRLGRVISADATASFFARHDGCELSRVSTPVPNAATDDGTETVRFEYPDCVDSRVVLYQVDRGGHTWPGAPQNLPERVVGKTSRDFDATKAVWDFFKSLPPRR